MSAQRGSMATMDGFHHHRESSTRMETQPCTTAPTPTRRDQQRTNQKYVFFTPRSPAPHRSAHPRYDQQQQPHQYDDQHAFFTARRSTADAHGSSADATTTILSRRVACAMDRGAGNESDVMETARDTARSSTGFDTDDYMSTFEPGTSRTSTSAFQDARETRGDAPAYGFRYESLQQQTKIVGGGGTTDRMTGRVREVAQPNRRNSESSNMSSMLPGQSLRRRRVESSAIGVARNGHDSLSSNYLSEYPDYSAERASRTQVEKKKDGDGGHVGFRQNMVKDIFSYARHNRVDGLERMMDQGVPVDVRDSHGNTILIVACQNGHKRALKAALRRGADPNATNAIGNTALHFCYAFGYGDTLGRYLMDKGADSSMRNRSGLVCNDGIGH